MNWSNIQRLRTFEYYCHICRQIYSYILVSYCLSLLYFRSIKFGELQRALGEEDTCNDVTGWRLVDRLQLTKEADQSDDIDNETNKDRDHVFDENCNNVETRPFQNGEKQMRNGSAGSDENEPKVRRKSSSFQAQSRRKSSTARFS